MTIFIILHYMAIDSTLNAVNHILNDLYGSKRIIIVDNHSPNESGKKLFSHFANIDCVDVLLNKENFGFARGCNVGYEFAHRYNADFYVLLNNDIEFTNKKFIQQIQQSFTDEYFDVLGPDVLVPETGVHQNPKKYGIYTYDQVLSINRKNKKLLNQSKFKFALRASLKNILLLRSLKVKLDSRKSNVNLQPATNVVLHGSILVFSKGFIDHVKFPFDENTFFYFETEIMSLNLKKRHLISKFDPSICVLHHQNTATRETFNNVISRQKFQLDNMVNSTEVYLKLVRNQSKEKK